MGHGFSHIQAGIELNKSFEYYLLAKEYGWTHEEIMNLTRPEAIYYLLAPRAYERWSIRQSKTKNRRK